MGLWMKPPRVYKYLHVIPVSYSLQCSTFRTISKSVIKLLRRTFLGVLFMVLLFTRWLYLLILQIKS